MKTLKNNNRGFTLVDVICAITILMLVVLPVLTGFLMAAKTNAKISDRLEVDLVLQNELEQIKATGVIENVRYDGNSTTAVLEKGEYGGNNLSGVMLPKGKYTKTSSEIDMTILIDQVKINVDGNNSIAYYIITITYDNETEDDTSDDVILKGVYSPW